MKDWQKAIIALAGLTAGLFYLSRPQTESDRRRQAQLIARERSQRLSAQR